MEKKNIIIVSVVGIVVIAIIATVLILVLNGSDSDENINQEPLFLTALIEKGEIAKARELAQVKLKGAKNITSYAGLFTVNPKYNSTLFFWYFESEVDQKEAPVLLWLNGGPGTSSMLGMFEEHGPFLLRDTKSEDLQFRQHHWSKNHHVIYIDNPVGVGYSFTEDDKGYSESAKDCAVNLHEALRQFFIMFPDLSKNKFFLTGESYAGKYVPALGSVILDEKKIKNFEGVFLGNALVDPAIQSQGFGEYLYWQGFIDKKQLEEFEDIEKKCMDAINEIKEKPEDAFKYCRGIVDPWKLDTLFYKYTGYTYTYNILTPSKDDTMSLHREDFMDLESTRNAIHVGKIPRIKDPAKVQEKLGISLLLSEKDSVNKILEAGKTAMIFNGQLDVQIPHRMSANMLETLPYAKKNNYLDAPKNIWLVNDNVAGYVKIAGNLQEVMVIGTGHMVPEDKPLEASDLITKFSRGQPLKIKT